MFHSHYKKNISIAVIISTLFGFVGAIAALYLFQTISTIPLLGIFSPFPLSRGNQPIIFEQAREVTVSFDTGIANVLRDSDERLAFLFDKDARRTSDALPFFTPDDAVGLAVSLTSDGWFLSSGVVFEDSEVRDIVVGIKNSNNRVGYAIEQLVYDTQTDAAFFKVSPDIDLPVSRFRSNDELTQGETLIVRSGTHTLNVGTLSAFDDDKAVAKSTESPFSVFTISYTSAPPSNDLDAKIVYDLAGRVVGLTDAEGNIFSTDWETIIESMLRGGIIERPYMGLTYLHIDDLIGLSADALPPVNHGGWIRDLPGTSAFASDSPLLTTDIKEGDVIISVQNEPITKNKTLTDLVRTYQPNDVITLGVVSPNGQRREVQVQLTAY